MPVHNEKNKSLKSTLFVDYRPAELKISTQWLVVYYAKNPISQEMQRFRVVVPVLKSVVDRKKLGKTIAVAINLKLDAGWLPFYSDVSSNDFKTYRYCKKVFLDQLSTDIKKGLRRPDTERAYNSYFSMIELFVTKKELKFNFLFEMNRAFITNYLDFILYDRNNSHRTHNNHLGFIIGFLNFCQARGFIKENGAIGIAKKKEGEKIRLLLTPEIKAKIKEFETVNFHYFVLCMTTYYCFVRRTELTKLKVHHISLANSTMTIPSDIAKNHKEATITIPTPLAYLLAKHLQTAVMSDYVFSANNFTSGSTQLNPKKISDVWEKMRQLFTIPKWFQFYSLKDSGITDLLNSGVASLRVKNQARHEEISTTEKYTHKNKICDDAIKNAGFDF